MSPEYGATCGFFPVDELTLDYLRADRAQRPSGSRSSRRTARRTCSGTTRATHPTYSQVVELDLGAVEPSLAGPRRPQDRVPLARAKQSFLEALGTFGVDYDERLARRRSPRRSRPSDPTTEQQPAGEPQPDAAGAVATSRARGPPTACAGRREFELDHGAVVIAAITSCTNTSNPQVMVAAGLLAKKAVERGLQPQPWVKSSLAPGSKVVTDYYERAGLRRYLDELGFNTVGYGCTTCIGNSGPLPTRSRPRSPKATSSRARCSRATATSRRASIPR